MLLKGAAIGRTPAEASSMLEQVEAACGGAPVLMRVCDDTGVWSRMVEAVMLTPDERWNRPRVPFQIDLIAPDPVRYSDPLTVGPVGLPVREGGLVLPAAFPWDFGKSIRPVGTLANTGALPIYPRMILSSSTPGGVASAGGVVVHGGPQWLSFGAFSGTLVFDSLERRAWLNGVDVTRDVIRRDWPAVPAGVSADFFFVADDPSPDLVLTVEYRIGVW